MRRTSLTFAIVGVLTMAGASVAWAQNSGSGSNGIGLVTVPRASAKRADSGGFGPGYTDVGPTVGLGGLGGASLSIGGRLEHGFKPLPNLGNGVLSGQVGFEYYHYSNFGAGFTYIPIGVTANYHFHIESNVKIDPFLGLGLGYRIVTTSYNGLGSYSASGVYFVGRAGLRYFLNDKIAAYGDVGAGAAAIDLGIMFKLAGAQS